MVKPEELLKQFETLGFKTQTHHHAALFTVEESRGVKETIKGAHSKNLLVKDKKGRIFALITLSDATLNLKTMHEKIGASGRLSFVNEEQLYVLFGVRPGSVTPFGAVNDVNQVVTMVLDAALMAHETLNFHPLVNTMTTSISATDLITFLRHTGHEPLVLAISD